MKQLFIISALCFLIPVTSSAQFGASVNYQSLTSSYWTGSVDQLGGEYLKSQVGGSLLYWFRMKEKRIEFLPEVGYSGTTGSSSEEFYVKQQKFSAVFNTDVYLFDIINDCDCPTFSKQGTFFQKSFFLELSPGVDYQLAKLEDNSAQERSYDDSQLTFRMGFGLGLDFGLSDMVTLTPVISMNYSSRPGWGSELQYDDNPAGSDWFFKAGLRAIFRPDYSRRFRR